MTRRSDAGYCSLWSKYGGDPWRLALGEYARVRTAWMSGTAFVDTVGTYGERITVRLGDISSICEITPPVRAIIVEEIRLDREEERADNLLNGES